MLDALKHTDQDGDKASIGSGSRNALLYILGYYRDGAGKFTEHQIHSSNEYRQLVKTHTRVSLYQAIASSNVTNFCPKSLSIATFGSPDLDIAINIFDKLLRFVR